MKLQIGYLVLTLFVSGNLVCKSSKYVGGSHERVERLGCASRTASGG